MKEKSFKKGIVKRLFSVVITLVLIMTLMPSMTVKAEPSSPTWTKYEGYENTIWYDTSVVDFEETGEGVFFACTDENCGTGEFCCMEGEWYVQITCPHIVTEDPTGGSGSDENCLTFTAEEDGATMKFGWKNTETDIVQIKPSSTDVLINGVNVTSTEWQAYKKMDVITLPSEGNSVSFKGTGVLTSSSDTQHFTIKDKKIAASGDVTSLTNGSGGDVTLTEDCYRYMFNSCTGLTKAPNLPATTLKKSCYSNMFAGCTGLTSAPELPATTLAESCYYFMFWRCTGLTSAPELPVTTMDVGCYAGMFSGCTKLESAPNLPATVLVDRCYINMFENCTSLSNAPELKVTTLGQMCCISMFSGCTNLKVVETTDESEATWIFPASGATRWNADMIKGLTAPGTLTAVEAGKMYKVNVAPPPHVHDWTYEADGPAIKAYCTDGCPSEAVDADTALSLTLTATAPGYNGIEGLDDFKDATGLTVSKGNVQIYQVAAEGVTTGGTLLTSAPTEDGYYYASLTVGGETAVKAFTVGTPVVHVTGVALNKSATTLKVGATETLVATVTPDNATTKTVTWSSDKESVATVDENGKVTAVAAGTATITVKTTDENKTATCVVTVEADGDAGLVVPVLENPAAVVDDSVIDELKNKVDITAEEQEKIDEGQKLNISLEIVNNEGITAESKTAIENKMIESLGEEAKVGKYIDISLFKWFEGDNKEEGRITDLGEKEIEIKITVPDDIYAANRDYRIARNHSGKVDILGTYDKETKVIAVKTGLFSDYAIVYTEDKDPENEDPENEDPEYDYAANSIKLSSKIKLTASTNATIEWTAVDGADAYEIYMNYCGKTTKAKLVKTVKADTTKATIKKLNKKAINQKKNIKAYVVAIKNIDGKKVRIGKSITLHAAGKKVTKSTDAKKITVEKSSVSLKKGKTSKIKATTVKASADKKVLTHTAEFRYASSNKKVAKVDKNGKITAVSEGSCTVYVYAINGCTKKIKVTVK